jgi:Icc protein
MPIHLPPFSRRNFLKRSLLAGAGVMFSHSALAARRRVEPDSWALFSDTHISGDTKKLVRGTNMADNLRVAVRDVLALPHQPAGLLHGGDCAYNSGEADDYFQLTALLDPLREAGMPLHLALGNHDHRDHFWDGLSLRDSRARAISDRQVSLIRSPKVNWYVLDSLETTLQTPGLIGMRQLDWLAKSLDANPRKPAIVLVHHNPGTREKINGLKDTEALLQVIQPRRQVKAWVFGHTHTWSTTVDDSGLHLINLPPVAYIFRAGDPAGWLHATMRRDGMDLTLRKIGAGQVTEGPTVSLEWRKIGSVLI